MINILLGIFYVVLLALVSYLLYFIIKIAIKDAYYEIEFKNDDEHKTTYEKTNLDSDDE